MTNSEPEDSDEDIAFNIGKIPPKLRDQWLADTGATAHMCNNKVWFNELVLFKKPDTCMVGNGKKIDVLGVGTGSIMCTNSNLKLNLKSVLYMPELAANLISVGAASEKGIAAIFSKDECHFQRENKILFRGERLTGKLCKLYIRAKLADMSRREGNKSISPNK